mmetsp:Transcript_74663/g.172950  ORF Transcript_74663/g.172950 Transcript_74663/m.172950 type:complete len:206 (-) Transcript_74663:796-1413(-)
MHGIGPHGVALGQRPAKVLVHQLSDEGRDGRQQHRDVEQHAVEGAEACKRLLLAVLPAEPPAVHADVNVCEVLQEGEQAGHHRVEAIGFHLLTDKLDEAVAACIYPLVHEVTTALDAFWVVLEFCACALVTIGFQHEEAVGMVPGQEHVLYNIPHPFFLELQRLRPDHRRVAEVHANGVGTMSLHYLLGIGVVLQALAHLLAVRS